MDNLQQLTKLAKVINTDKIITQEEIQQVIQVIVGVLANNKKEVISLNEETKILINQLYDRIVKDQVSLEGKIKSELSDTQDAITSENDAKLAKFLQEARMLLNEARAAMPQDGKDADPADVVPLVIEQIKLPETFVLQGKGEQIVAEINDLPTEDDELKIDAKHIKNLPKEVQKHSFAVQRNLAWYDESTLLIENPTKIKFAGAGVQATVDSEGAVLVTITGSAGSESNGETLTDSGNHISFTFAHTPSSGGVRNVWIKETGQLLTPTTDYTISGSTLTATRAQVDGDGNAFTLIANYTY